jgi:hypothetical protein
MPYIIAGKVLSDIRQPHSRALKERLVVTLKKAI